MSANHSLPPATAPVCEDLVVLALEHYFPEGPQASGFFNLYVQKPQGMIWRPGQFAMIRPAAWDNAMWARPLSICTGNDDTLCFFCQVAGRGTKSMAGLNVGDKLTVWGPLGNGFAMEDRTPTLLLAGGVGLAPFVGYYAKHPNPDNLRLEFGHRQPLFCYPMTKFPEGANVTGHLEQGPDDLKAFLSLTGGLIEDYAARDGLVLACGPTPFLKFVQEQAIRHKARAQISLENRMACGVGACLGCAVNSHGARQEGWPIQVCLHGPVFRVEQVDI